MRRLVVVLTVSALAAAPVVASDRDDVLAVAHQFVDGFNKGDTTSAIAACAEGAMIIDEFPPHAWSGCGVWADAYDADAKKNGITDAVVTLGKPKHVDVTGDRAYAVIPTDYAYAKKGKPVKETGSLLTITFQRVAAGWRITAWSWAKN